jgi:hypothetical protein
MRLGLVIATLLSPAWEIILKGFEMSELGLAIPILPFRPDCRKTNSGTDFRICLTNSLL